MANEDGIDTVADCKLALDRLRESEVKCQALFDNANDAISGKPQFFEWKHCRYDETPFDAEVSLNQVETAKDSRLLQAMVRDVSERTETESRLRVSEEKYWSIFENVIEGIFQTTPRGKVITANTTFASVMSQ
jgi:hypothetical protein